MRVVLQRVRRAAVAVEGDCVGEIDAGLLLLVGIAPDDDEATLTWMTKKVTELRVFTDDVGKMNRSVLDTGGAILAVSQFTLYGDTRKGRRPSFVGAAPPEIAEPLFDRFCVLLRECGVNVPTGRFGEHMNVTLDNDGPVTLILER